MTDQLEANYQWFQERLLDLLSTHKGKHALLHQQEIVDYFETSLEAIKVGISHFGEGNFSVELVDDKVEDLGFYSHVNTPLHA